MIRVIGFALAVAFVVACTSARVDPGRGPTAPAAVHVGDSALALHLQRQKHLLDVSYRIRTRGVALCADQVGPVLGIAVWTSNPLHSPEFRRALFARFGIRSLQLLVVAVQPDSPAQRAGLREGDRIDRVEGNIVRSEFDVFDRSRAARGPLVHIEGARERVPFQWQVKALPACRHEVFLESGDLMLTDRSGDDHAYVTSGFVRFARSDDELAAIVAHEIAHRLIGPSALRGPEVETRADQIGMHLAARAGFDVSIAPRFWDRVALEQPWSLSNEVEHYGLRRVPPHGYMPSRAVALRKIAESIRGKLARDEPLLPE